MANDTCDCGCGNRARPGLRPRFAGASCRQRWIDKLAIHDRPTPGTAKLDRGPQELPPPADPIPVQEVAEVQAEFAQRVTVAPAVETMLESAPSGTWVQPRPRSLWKTLRGLARRVW